MRLELAVTGTTWYRAHAPWLAAGVAGRPGDLVALCPDCPVLPVAVLRHGPEGWAVIARPWALAVEALPMQPVSRPPRAA